VTEGARGRRRENTIIAVFILTLVGGDFALLLAFGPTLGFELGLVWSAALCLPLVLVSIRKEAAVTPEHPVWRFALQEFVKVMKDRLEANAEKGDTWLDVEPADLEAGLQAEVGEAGERYASETEWADVANYAMFLWYRRRMAARLYEGIVRATRGDRR
jgi:hypothetical protein